MLRNPFKRNKRPEFTPDDILFLRMEGNAKEFYKDKTFWHELHKVCNELTPGCIFVEKFAGAMAHDLSSGRRTDTAFHPGEKTLVIELKNKETAIEAADLLQELFKSTGTRFFAEIPDGSNTPQIRSNIDHQQQTKLGVISKFFHNREITDHELRKEIHKDCQRIIDAYTKGTEFEGEWKARTGVLPFVSLMGLHGILRPKERKPINKTRIEARINKPHPHGDPAMLKEVVTFVEMDRNGDIYTLMYDPIRYAYREAQGGMNEGQFSQELFGGAVIGTEETSPAVKALRATWLALGIKETALAAAGIAALVMGTRESLEAIPGVAIVGTISGIVFGIDWAVKSWKKTREDKETRKRLKFQREFEIELAKQLAAEQSKIKPLTFELEAPPDPNIQYGYTHGYYGDDERAPTQHCDELNFIKRIISDKETKSADVTLQQVDSKITTR